MLTYILVITMTFANVKDQPVFPVVGLAASFSTLAECNKAAKAIVKLSPEDADKVGCLAVQTKLTSVKEI